MRALLLASLLAVSWTAPAMAGTAPWLTSYDEARAVARQTGKPLLVVFR